MRQVVRSATRQPAATIERRALNAFGQWALANGLGTPSKLGEKLKKPRGQVWHWILALEDPDFVVPRPGVLEAIFALTGGAIEPNHFYAVEAWRARAAQRAAA